MSPPVLAHERRSPGAAAPRATTTSKVQAAEAKHESTTAVRQEPERHAWATPVLVLGTRGRLRLVLVVERCAWGCGQAHVHGGPVDFIAGRRTAGCNGKSYTVHSLAERQAVA